MKKPLSLAALFATLVLAAPAVAQSGANHIRLTVSGKGVTKLDELTVIPATESTAHP